MSKPNFVFIMTDTQATNMVGCYTGIKALNTNHIDDLAKSGVKFNSGYTTTPVCTPARASLFTGLYSHSSGPWTNNIALGRNVKTMGHYFKEQGYDTVYAGKWHLDGHDYFGTGRCPEEWDDKYWYDGANYLAERSDEEISLWRNGLNSAEDMRKHNITAEFTWANGISNRGIEFLESRDTNKPFLMVLSYDEPHHPFTCPAEYIERFSDFAYDVGEKAFDSLDNKPAHHRLWAEAMGSPVDEQGKYHHPLYFGCNDYVDDEIGRVLNKLNEQQLKNTWIIYTSDHGEMMGAHRMISKGAAAYDDITRIPFLIRAPQGSMLNQTEVDTPVSHIDLLPTMLAIADIEIPEILEGDNLLDIMSDKNRDLNRGVLIEFNRYEMEHDSFGGFIPMRAWVNNDYKLVLNLFSKDELYCRRTDKDELYNLIDNPAYSGIRNQLHDELLNHMYEKRDPFRTYEWSMRSWRPEKKAEWIGSFRPRPKDGFSPVVRDYDTGMPSKGVHLEDKKQKF